MKTSLPGSLSTTAALIRQEGRQVLPISMDLLDEASVEEAFKSVQEVVPFSHKGSSAAFDVNPNPDPDHNPDHAFFHKPAALRHKTTLLMITSCFFSIGAASMSWSTMRYIRVLGLNHGFWI
jgi:hypothetical protein